ncbi:MAG: hypothetical protein RSC44_01355 [Clostridia bacterium]
MENNKSKTGTNQPQQPNNAKNCSNRANNGASDCSNKATSGARDCNYKATSGARDCSNKATSTTTNKEGDCHCKPCEKPQRTGAAPAPKSGASAPQTTKKG